MTRRTRSFLLAGVATVLVLLIGAGIGVDRYVKNLSPRTRDRVVKALEDRFDADVELARLDVSLFPQPSVVGAGLTIRHKGWADPHPLLAIARFDAHANFWDLLFQHDNVDVVRLEGLQVHVPPRGRAVLGKTFAANEEVATDEPGQDQTRLSFSIDRIIADGALLEIEPKIAGKDPLQFQIQKLSFYSVAPGEPLRFTAKLQNAKPPGLIDSDGRFGPWQKDDPRATAVSGSYRFQNADLGVFKGISGTLSSQGSYQGVLQHIEVSGTTDTPQFALKRGGAPVHLQTKFHSIVNGTDGDTILDPVDATFLNSEFLCRGGILKEHPNVGKTVSLHAVTKHGRMEDILLLVTGDRTPVLTGAVDFRSSIVIPPGKQDVIDKLTLDGQFRITRAHFTSPKVEQRLEILSDRARGISKAEEEEEPPQTVASNFFGKYRLNRGTATFSTLQFEVPGAQIRLAGDYNIESREIDMYGVFRMQSTLAETQSGWKRWLLKPMDPLFRKDGAGFQVPLKLSGSREHPTVSVEMFHHQFTLKR